MFSAPFLAPLLDRVKAIVRRVARPVAERVRAVQADAATPCSPVLCGAAQRWMSGKVRALSALMRRIEAGETSDTTVRARSVAHDVDAPSVRAALPPQERLPRGFGWMCTLGPNVRRDGRAFSHWLNDPAMQAMVLAEPERMARVIGPILTATGEAKPDWFSASPKRRNGVRRFRGRGPQSGAAASGCCDLVDPDLGSRTDLPGLAACAQAREPAAVTQLNRRSPVSPMRPMEHNPAPSTLPTADRSPFGIAGGHLAPPSTCTDSFRKNETKRRWKNCVHFVTIS